MPIFRVVKPYLILALTTALYYSGALRLYQLIFGKPFAVILNYHRILAPTQQERELLPAMFVSPESFDKHLRFLARHYRVVTMRQLMEAKATRFTTGRSMCVITFDDGWRDNYRYAFPLLKQHRLTATIFISTDFIGSGRVPWFYALLQSLDGLSIQLGRGAVTLAEIRDQELPEPIIAWSQLEESERTGAVERVIEALKLLHAAQVNEAAEKLSQLVRKSAGDGAGLEPAMLSWGEVREMRQYGIEIGSHGVTHSILTRVSDDQLDEEVWRSKKIIEQELQETIVGFSYPNGDYSEKINHLLTKAGYIYACTIKPGYVDYESPPFRLNRLLLHNDNTYTMALFACHMAGLFNRGRE